MSLLDEVERGDRAKRLLEDETLIAARAEVERVIHEEWANAPIRDREGAHELKLMLKALGNVWTLLERAVTDGKLAADELKQLNGQAPLSPADFRAQFPTR